MKFELEVVKFNATDVITASGNGGAPVCCDFGCGTDLADLAGNI